MENFAQPLQLAAATIGMVVALLLAFIPLTPGPILLWIVAIIFGFSENFHRLTPVAAVVMTVLTLASVTNDFWLPFLGFRTGGLTCFGAIGSFIGGIVGGFMIPVPIFGSIVGAMIGAGLLELIRFRQHDRAWEAGESALKLIIMSYVLNLIVSILVFATYIISLLTTG